jgi:ethanolamine ammonia-lyase small subunit
MTSDPWTHLRRHTSARIALGRAGGSLPTREVLAFAAAHAAARDAVHEPLDVDRLEGDLRAAGLDAVRLSTAAPDRHTYLRRPDLGRRLDDPSRAALEALARGDGGAGGGGGVRPPELAVMVSEGLSAPAAQHQAVPLLAALVPMLRSAGVSVSPVLVVRLARVAAQDEAGRLLGAKAALILLGERPGLGSADSLGAYLVFDPRPGRTDADRNCVSNIRPGGLAIHAAAATLHYLLTESLRRRISGVTLKDERVALPAPPSPGALPPA